MSSNVPLLLFSQLVSFCLFLRKYVKQLAVWLVIVSTMPPSCSSHVLLWFVCSISHDLVAGLGHCRKERIYGGIYGSGPFSIAWASRNCFGAAF